ncbi:MAG: FHA domain-containing protein [Phycisphaeraceae bacterium]
MSTIQIHITAGSQAGARLKLNQSPATFGRSADCTLVLDVPVVSRLHGELQRDEQDNWLLINHSPNGTRVGRKKATKKPVPLTDNASITIGDTEVFRVHLTQDSADAAAAATSQQAANDDDAPDNNAPGTGLKGRSKLWIGIGVWVVFLIGLSVFLATLGGGDDGPAPETTGLYNPGQDIEDLSGEEAGIFDIRRLLADTPPFVDPNASRYSDHIQKANRAFDQGTDMRYDAYRHFQQAGTYSDNQSQPLQDPGDVTRYNRVLDDLADMIYRRYIRAYRLYHSGDYEQATAILDDLRLRFYRSEDPDDKLANHILRLRNAAHDKVN